MKDLWDQTTIDFQVMQNFIVLAFFSFLMVCLFSLVINIGSHSTNYELPPLQKYVIAFVSTNLLLSLMFFLSLAYFEIASYLSLISIFLIIIQWMIYFFHLQPTFLFFEFKKSYTKLDSLLNKNSNITDKIFYEEYKSVEDHLIMSKMEFRIKSYQIALVFVLGSKKNQLPTQDLSLTSISRLHFKKITTILISYLIFMLVMQVLEIILVNLDFYDNIGVLLYGLIRIIITLAFLIYFPSEMICFYKLLRKQNLPIKIAPLLLILFMFNVQKPLVDIICICLDIGNSMNYANIINFFMLSMENLGISIAILSGYSYKGLCFAEYKSIIARFKTNVRLTEEISHASYIRYENEKSGVMDGSMMKNMTLKQEY